LNLTETLSQGSQSVLGGRHRRTQALLITSEFALAITLLAGAGMAIHSFWKLTNIDLGFRKDHVLIARLHKPSNEHPSPEQVTADARQLLDNLRALPGVQNASLSTGMPLDGAGPFPFTIAGQPTSDANQKVADFESVTPSFFDTFGVRLLQGRLLNDNDTASSTRVIVVSDSFIQQFLPNLDPLTQRLVTPTPLTNQKFGSPVEWQIVGVFREVRNGEHITDKTQPEAYVPFWQDSFPNVGLAVRTAGDPALVAKSVRAAVSATAPMRLLSQIDTIDHKIDDEFKGERFGMVLFGSFAALALLLAALGIYGVMAFAVAQRHHEIGLRMALGAQRDEVVTMILFEVVRLALLGVAFGLVGVYGLGRLMHSTLYGVQTIDGTSFAAVALVLVAAAVMASYIPARRAAKVDPMVALRYE
jgi:putative ABC transport system permease protein